MNQFQHATIAEMLGHSPQQTLMVNTVKELRQVDVYRVRATFLEVPSSQSDGGLGSPITAKTVTAIVKDWLEDRFDHLMNRLLNHSIDDVRDGGCILHLMQLALWIVDEKLSKLLWFDACRLGNSLC